MIFDNFKTKTCEDCGYQHDVNMPECPKCGRTEENFLKKPVKNPLIFIDTPRLLIVLVIYLFTFIIIPIIAGMFIDSSNNLHLLILQLVIYLIGIFGICFTLKTYLKYFLKNFLHIESYAWGIIIGALMIGLSLGYSYLLTKLNIDTNSNQVGVETMVNQYQILSFFVVVIFGPIYEEFIFRVAIFDLFHKFNKVTAYIVTILLFVLVHLNFIGNNINPIAELAAIPSYLICSISLTFLYDRFGYSASLTAHILNNLVSYLLIVMSIAI